MAERSDVLVVAGMGDAQDLILSAVAAQELAVTVTTDLDALAVPWREAGVVLVADDQAERLAARALPHREGVYLVGWDSRRLAAWSTPLSARVIGLPEGAAWLGAVLADGSARARAPVVAVVGGSGGVGASTLAAALAQLGAERPEGAALVDVDPSGGGIDLLLGAEQVQGWRWPGLRAAEGQLGDLRPQLPVVERVSVVSMAREVSLDLAGEPLTAVIGGLRSWHSLVVVDPGRSLAPASREAVRLASRHLLVVAGGVRGVAAARQTVAALGLEHPEVVLRRWPGGLPADLVAEAVGYPVVAVLPEERALRSAAERGEPPARGARRGYRKAVARLLAEVAGGRDG